MLVTDLDGTLLDAEGRIHACDQEAIAELGRRGVLVTIVTGRMYSGTREVARILGLRGPVGCVDGSQIVDAGADCELWHDLIRAGDAALLRRRLERADLITVAFVDDTLVYDQRALGDLPYLTKWSERTARVGNVLEELGGEQAVRPSAVISLGRREVVEQVASSVLEPGSAIQCVTFHARTDRRGPVWAMMVRARGTSKATAVEWIAAYHRIPLGAVIAIGDWINDIPMLRRVGRSFAMAQSPPEVRAAADEVLTATSLTGGGIAEAARRSGLL